MNQLKQRDLIEIKPKREMIKVLETKMVKKNTKKNKETQENQDSQIN